jgi:hypothetical protein
MAANPFLSIELDVLGLVNRTPQGVAFASVSLMSASDSFSRMIVIQLSSLPAKRWHKALS